MHVSCRSFVPLLPFVFLFVLFLGATTAAGAQLGGLVVDQAARPIPRVLVTATDASGRELARAFTAHDGSFRLDVNTAGGCLLEARLTGFRPTRTGCEGQPPIRVVLIVAPLEEVIVVSATRTDTPAGQLASSVTVFTESDMARRQRPMLAELLRGAPGATVVAGMPGAVTGLFVRGGESNYTKVLLDGIPLNEPGGTFDFSNVSSSHLSRVELVRGAHSALFGSDAVAGVLQLFTRRAAPGEPLFDASMEGGAFGTWRGTATIGGASSRWDYSLHASHLDTDNEGANHAFRDTTLSTSAGVRIDSGTTLRFVGRSEASRAGAPGQTAFGRPDLDAFFERRDIATGVRFDQHLSPALHQSAAYSFALSHQQSTNLIADTPYTPRFGERAAPFEFFDFLYDIDNRIGRHHAGYQLDWRARPRRAAAGEHLITVAADWDGERATLEDRQASGRTKASRDNVGWTVQQQAMWPRLFVTGGLRLEQNDSFGFAVVPRGSVAYVARQADGLFGTTTLKASAGAGVKEPTIIQSFSPSPVFPGNPDLEAERSRTFDAGVAQTLLNGAITVEATWFANRFRNIISTRTVSFNPFTLEFFNIGVTTARGMEITGELARYSPITVRAGYTLLASEIVESAAADNPVFGIGRALFRRPRHSGFVDVGADVGSLSLSVFGAFVGRSVDSDFASLEPPIVASTGYRRWDVRAAYAISRRLTVTAAIDNVFDASYMEPLGYPALGRGARAGVRVAF